jgi:hypothetical protein
VLSGIESKTALLTWEGHHALCSSHVVHSIWSKDLRLRCVQHAHAAYACRVVDASPATIVWFSLATCPRSTCRLLHVLDRMSGC